MKTLQFDWIKDLDVILLATKVKPFQKKNTGINFYLLEV